MAHLLDDLHQALSTSDGARIEVLESRLNNLAFAGRVRARLGGSGRPAPAVAPTKQSPALPIAGAICGALLLGLGWALGGGVLLIGTGALAVFVLGIALAGTTTVSGRRSTEPARQPEVLVAPPTRVVSTLADLERALGSRPELGRPAPE